MKKENNEQTIKSKGSRKVAISAKISPDLKNKLLQEAQSMGISLSELIEIILATKDNIMAEVETLKQEVMELKTYVAVSQNNYSIELNQSLQQLENSNAEKQRINEWINSVVPYLDIYKEPRLQKIFEGVKGKTDTVETSDGRTFPITYTTSKDLLTAMIHSYELNNPKTC